MLRSSSSRALPEAEQLQPGLADTAMRLGRDLDLGLQGLPSDMPSRAEIGALEERIWCLRGDL